jgi:hypothetical protein
MGSNRLKYQLPECWDRNAHGRSPFEDAHDFATRPIVE